MRVIDLGFACNNHCVFCAQGELGSAASDDEALVARVEAALAAIEPREAVAFAGGEPTLRRELDGWITTAAARGASAILVQTNGRRLAYFGYARALAAAAGSGRHLSFEVSLQGSTAAMHDYHTNVEGSFAQTIVGMRHARALRVPFAVATVVTRSNFRHLSEIAPKPEYRPPLEDDPVASLNDKETKVLQLIAEGKSNKQIAGLLFLAEGTVKNYVSRIMEKLHAGSRTELAVMALRQRRVE